MKRVTQQDVARELGVSRTLVSYAFRDAQGVAPETKERILAAARRLGYRPDMVASQLASLRSNTTGLVLLDLSFEISTEIFYGLRSHAERVGRRIVLTIGDSQTGRDRQAMDDLIDMRVDAMVLAGAVVPDEVLQNYAAKIPLVVVTRKVPGVDSVLIDDVEGARLAVEHLVELGHRRIAHIAPPEQYPYTARAVGYVESMVRAGLTPRVLRAGFDQLAGARAAASLLDSADPPTALFCNNDVTALGVMDMAAERGLRIPDDLSVIGYDDTHAASLPGVSLTSVGQQARELGEIAGEQAMARVADPGSPPVVKTLHPALVVRSSTASPGRVRP